jgi:hypothetical protein
MSQLAIVEAFADLPDTRRKAGQRHHQALCLALFTRFSRCRESGIFGNWGLVECPSLSISCFISTAPRTFTLLQHDSPDMAAVRISGLFGLFVEVLRDSSQTRRNNCDRWQSVAPVL